MANNKKWGTKFLTIISALSLVGAGALVAISPASAVLPATYTLVDFSPEDTIGNEADQANSGDHPQGHWGNFVATIVDGVLEMAKYGDSWSGDMITHFTDRKVGAIVAFDWYQPESGSVTNWFKLEDTNGQNANEGSFVTVNGWQQVVIHIADLSNFQAGVDYTNIIVFPNYDGANNVVDFGATYKIDNVESYDGPNLPETETGITFADDDIAVGNASAERFTGAFEGLSTTASDGELNMVKTGNPWAGVTLRKYTDMNIGPDVSFTFDSAEAATACVKVENLWATADVNFPFEAAAGSHDYTLDLSSDDEWSDEDQYSTIVFFPNYNCDGTSDAGLDGQTYKLSNLSLNGYAFASAPVKSKNPKITGSAKVGKKLTADGFIASWEGEPTLAYQWFACTKKGTNTPSVKPSNCKSISGASAKKLTLKKAQKGKFIRVRVTATNDAGSTAVFSKSTSGKVS
jgi:hypothetical protein